MRNIKRKALILTVKPQGENNRLITFLTKEEGLLTSLLYGGPKSRLRSLVSPWNFGELNLYNDEVRHLSKITDFDVEKYHPTFRESLYKTMAANVSTEIIMLTKCAGSNEECFTLLNGFLDGLDILDEQEGKKGLIRFLFRYLALLGIQPGDFRCIKCKSPFYSGNSLKNDVIYKSGGAFYSQSENGFICSDCVKSLFENSEKKHLFELTPKAVSYLEATSTCEPSVSRKMQLTAEEILALQGLVFSLISSGVGTKIKSLQSGIGIL
ncbi:MAG: DNA repair protein RecO [Treponema sp.]|nr:DNA repair protein RecO [Treponema sp.]